MKCGLGWGKQMARQKRYEMSKMKQIRCAVERFEKLNNTLVKGTAETIHFELKRIQNLLHLIEVNLPATKRIFLRAKLWRQIREIEQNEKLNRGWLKTFFDWKLSKSTIARIEQLKKKMPDYPSTHTDFDDSDYEKLKSYKIKLLEYEKLILRSLKPAEARDKERIQLSIKLKKGKELSNIKKLEKENQTKAMAAAHTGKTRQLAQTIRHNIKQQRKTLSVCPYCGLTLGHSPKADHIYPVAKGGLSTEKNMVFICAKCNSLKSDKTLRVFVKQNGLNWSSVEKHLEVLRKDF